MKTICRISGLPIWKSNLLMGMDLADEHPIFKMKNSLILTKDMIHRFSSAENVDEKRLIYLATINATHLITFEHVAIPSLKTMEATFYRASPLAQWVNFAEYKFAKIVSFPQYVVRKDNADLSNIKSWLESLEDIKNKVSRKELDRDKNAALLQKEMEIKKELGDANFFGKAFTPKLARWALELCDVTSKSEDYAKWMKHLCVPLNEAWMYKLEDFYELQEVLQNGLPNLEMNPQAISVMHQMKSLITECRRGFTEFSIFDDKPVGETDFEIIEDDDSDLDNPKKITHKINQHLLNVPSEEPLAKNYVKKVEYLIAKAKWDIAQAKANKTIDETGV
jgi:hypothetical protein